MSNSRKVDKDSIENYSFENLTDMPSEPSPDDIQKLKNIYLPQSKENYRPSETSIESANGLSHPKPPSPNSLT